MIPFNVLESSLFGLLDQIEAHKTLTKQFKTIHEAHNAFKTILNTFDWL